jgi:hypothetical protein
VRALRLAFQNAHGLDVYPGAQAVLCPTLLGPQLEGHQTLTAGGTWDQTRGGGRPVRIAQLVARGTYHLVIAGKVSVPFVLTPPRH